MDTTVEKEKTTTTTAAEPNFTTRYNIVIPTFLEASRMYSDEKNNDEKTLKKKSCK